VFKLMFETFFESKECGENEREVCSPWVVGNKLLLAALGLAASSIQLQREEIELHIRTQTKRTKQKTKNKDTAINEDASQLESRKKPLELQRV
jgi:hypothetical protein